MTSQKKIRIGIVTENHFPRICGMEFAIHEIARSLAKQAETTVTVACGTMPEVPKNFPYPYKVYRHRSFSILTNVLEKNNIERMIRLERINVLHGSMLHGGGAKATRIGKKYNLPVVVMSHGSDIQVVPEIQYGALLDPNATQQTHYALKHADKIIAVSETNKQMIMDLGAKIDQVIVVHSGTLHAEIGAVPFSDMRSRYDIKPDDFVVITVGRNRPIKRMHLLFSALQVLCVGPIEGLRDLTETHGLRDIVILVGPIPKSTPRSDYKSPPFSELINLYRAANLFVSFSYMEAFGLSALDALACGTPILVSEKHGVRDVMREGKTGFTIKDDTPEQLANTLYNITHIKEDLAKQRTKIRNSVSHLTWDNTASQLREIYLSLIS